MNVNANQVMKSNRTDSHVAEYMLNRIVLVGASMAEFAQPGVNVHPDFMGRVVKKLWTFVVRNSHVSKYAITNQ